MIYLFTMESARQHSLVRKIISILTVYGKKMQGLCDFQMDSLRQKLPEVKCLYLTSSRHEMCTRQVLVTWPCFQYTPWEKH